jgi:hypothetical protein
MRLAEDSQLRTSTKCQSKHTSLVQGPEFEGWKKLSVDAISLTNESNAFEPPKKVLTPERPFTPNGAARYSPNVLVWICGVFIPDGNGEKRGVGAFEGGAATPSRAIE